MKRFISRYFIYKDELESPKLVPCLSRIVSGLVGDINKITQEGELHQFGCSVSSTELRIEVDLWEVT